MQLVQITISDIVSLQECVHILRLLGSCPLTMSNIAVENTAVSWERPSALLGVSS